VNQAYNVIVDHVSFFWANRLDVIVWADGLTGKAAAHNITIQNSISAEGTTPCYGYGFLAGAQNRRVAAGMTDIDFHHNLLIHHGRRMPEVKLATMRWVNNLAYNWSMDGSASEGGTSADYIANQYWRGANTANPDSEIIWHDPGVSDWGPPGDPSFFLAQNIGDDNPNPDGDQWSMITRRLVGDKNVPLETTYQRLEPLPSNIWPITVDDVLTLPETLFPHIGASQRLDGEGGWVNIRDELDQRAINDFTNRTGRLRANELEYGGRLAYNGGDPYPDEDADGMSDTWEATFGINDANGDADLDGYTNIEEFLNATDPIQRQAVPTPVPTPEAGPRAHISLVWLNFAQPENGKFQVEAQVTILDAQNQPISGLTVSGFFSGPASEQANGITGENGTASLKTSVLAVSGKWTFCVGNVEGYPMDWQTGSNACLTQDDPNLTPEMVAAMKERNAPRYLAKQVNLVLDGKLDEWDTTNILRFDQLKDKGQTLPTADDFTGWAMLGWNANDPGRIYVAVVVTDDQLQDVHNAINAWWEDDALEVLFDFKKEWLSEKGAQFGFGANGKDLSEQARTEGNVEWVLMQEGNRYIFEIAITPGMTKPGADFLAEVGKTIGLTIGYNDGDNAPDGLREHQLGWTPGQTWDPANWGLLVFDEEVASGK
jgi:hypothetical protein